MGNSANSQHKLSVVSIQFPSDLPDDRCQLRLLVEVRYLNGGKTASDSFVLPSSESFWNCKQGQPLRKVSGDHVEVDLSQVSDWTKTSYFDASSITSVRVTLYDTQGDGFWAKAEKDLRDLAKDYLGLVDSGGVREALAEVLGDKLGSGTGNGKKLFRKDGSYASGTMTFTGKGEIPDGSQYTVQISL